MQSMRRAKLSSCASCPPSNSPEDLLKCPTDHAADALRYLCMARPWAGNTEAEHRRQQEDIRNRIPPEPKDFIFTAMPDGSLRANYCMWHVINRRMREKRLQGW
jgi:hypothetical protein